MAAGNHDAPDDEEDMTRGPGPDYVQLPDAERIDELGDFVMWLCNAKPRDEAVIRSEIERYFYSVGDREAGDALSDALTRVLTPGIERKERRAILRRLDRFTRRDPAEAARKRRGVEPKREFQPPVCFPPVLEPAVAGWRDRLRGGDQGWRNTRIDAAFKLYLRDGQAILPTTEAIYADLGCFRTIEPVAQSPVAETERLRRALRRLFAAGNPLALGPARPGLSSPELKATAIADWGEFQRGLRMWIVTLSDEQYRIIPYVTPSGRNARPDPTGILVLPRRASFGAVAERMVEAFQAAVRGETLRPSSGEAAPAPPGGISRVLALGLQLFRGGPPQPELATDDSIYIELHLRQGTVYIPRIGRTRSENYLAVDPVAAVAVADTAGLTGAVAEAFVTGNPRIAMYDPDDVSAPLLRQAGARTQAELERGLSHWILLGTPGDYRLITVRLNGRKDWGLPDDARLEYLPPETDAAAVVERLVRVVQGAAAAGAKPRA